MRVPARLPTATENSTQTQHDVIEKIDKDNDEQDKSPPLYQIYHVLNLDDELKAHGGTNRNNLRDNASIPAFIWPMVRLVPNKEFDKDHDSSDRLQQFLKNRYFHEDVPWQFPTAVTKRYSSLHGVEYGEAPKALPAAPTSALWLAAPLLSFFLVLLLGILLRKIIRCFFAPQQNTCLLIDRLEEQQRSNRFDSPVLSQGRSEDNLSVTLSVESQYSESDNEADLPPPYSECGINSSGTNNPAFSFEELPPSYSTCLESLNNVDEIPKVHKGSVEVPQAPTDTDGQLTNIEDSDRSNIEHSSRTLSTVVDTTILDNRLVSSQVISDAGNGNLE